MKITVDVPVENIEGKSVRIELDSDTGLVAWRPPATFKTALVKLDELHRALGQLQAAADPPSGVLRH